ncbi:PAS domain S-box protein [Mucilaginibacter phyllosphaerae]|uniref:histidine kinase n=1 Tax=Mucilaginibacter phyllosphaerae TaxID=1812349 RepID=A0A4Y8ADD7_9SPHI|nr:PAS domain S-box protein [Mucilaginibacter phyllosphaerae]MBB3970291.1 PAS domain S-box-containing protein [Mucilaginibacter phyllosphaerae]TEW66664.1 PAS domain S-box protein [Mucilaginibacter phyllosphaerae]GGH11091.1 hypothetical protein GCM10007352_17160 [Mucilaginibacter phyllosphaerae]
MNNFDILFYSSPSPMWVFDVATLQVLEVNDVALTEYGYSKKEFLSKTIIDLRPKGDIKLITDILPQIRSHHTNFREFRHQRSNGTIFYVEIMSHPIVFNGKEARIVVTQNIEDKKAIAGRLKLTQRKLNSILETTSIGYLQVNRNHVVTYWNKAAENMIGYNRKYILGKNLWDVFPETLGTDFDVQYRLAIKKKHNKEFISYFWPLQKWFAFIIYFVEEDLFIHFKDITDNKVYEGKLLEKIEQLKEVSYVNSHYMRKPVASLLGLTGLINNGIINSDEYKAVAQNIHECSLELDSIMHMVNNRVNDEYRYAVSPKMTSFLLNDLLDEVITGIKAHHTTHAILLKHKEEVSCYGDEQSIAAAIKYLIENAIRVSPEGDKVEVCLDVVDGNAIFAVKDFGESVDEKILSRIFISFAKKSISKKLGTGLAKVLDTAFSHNGSIWVERNKIKGSVFIMRLPIPGAGVYKRDDVSIFSEHRGPGFELNYDEALPCAVLEWYGFHTLQIIRAGCLKLLSLISHRKTGYVLMDSRAVAGTWSDATDWVSAMFFPMLQKAGITHVAWVYSTGAFNRSSTDAIIAGLNGTVTVKAFEDAAAAIQWLKDQAAYKPE